MTKRSRVSHLPLCPGQHSRLNQGKALWKGLENYILDSARTHGFKARVALHATAYLLSQGQLVRKLLEQRSRREALEGFVLGG